jgi:hypothetical protein
MTTEQRLATDKELHWAEDSRAMFERNAANECYLCLVLPCVCVTACTCPSCNARNCLQYGPAYALEAR